MSESEHSVRGIIDQQPDVCPNCGVRDNTLKGFGPILVFPDTLYTLLRSLFLKHTDDYHCKTCKQSMHLRPTIIIFHNEKRECLYCFGDRALTVSEELRKKFADALQTEAAQVEAFATLDELRAAYAKRIASMMKRINQGMMVVEEPKSVVDQWRDFPSNYFVAAALMLSVPLPEVQISLPEHDTLESAIDKLATFQAKVWLSLCTSWSGEIEQGRTLEGELDRYFVPEAMLHKAADEFLRATENANPKHWTAMGYFCLETLRASLCIWRKRPNPRLRDWVDLFVKWEVARRVLGEQSPPYLVAMEISAKRAHDTIAYEELFDACARQLGEHGLKVLEQLQEIGKKVGYPHLAEQLIASIQPLPEEGQVISVEQLLEALRASYKGDSPEALLKAASGLLVVLDKECSFDVLDQIAKGLEGILGKGDIESHAHVEIWLCSHLIKDGLPKAVLERIGDEAQPWEQQLALRIRTGLWTERSNALRMCGRGEEALAIAESVMADLKAADEPITPELRRNLGILYREAGQHEQALDIFLELLPDADLDLRLSLLNSITVTYSSLGCPAEAIPYLEAAAKLARGPRARSRSEVLATLAAAKSAVGERSEALTVLRQIPVDETDDLKVLLPYASAWVNLMQHPELLEKEDRKRLSGLVTKIKHAHDATLQSGNMQIHMHTNRLLAMLVELTQVEGRNVFWELVDVGAREFEGAPDPLALVALARDAWSEGDRQKARDYLLELPSAVAQRYAPEADISLKIDALDILRSTFNDLVELVFHSNSFEDLRLVAELKRDMLGRIAAASVGDREAPLAGFVVPDIQTIVRFGGPIAVFEWVDSAEFVVGLTTFITSDGTVREAYLSSPDVDLDQLAERVNQRLSVWHSGRAGTPLDLKEWQSFEQWLAKELEEYLPEGGRLVVIEHEEVAGLQWHVAAAPRWRVSYAPSWSVLLTARQPMSVKSGHVGLAMVPKYREAEDNLRALENSVSRTFQLATNLNLHMKSALLEACDRDALIEVLDGTTVAKVLCHGFVDPDEDVVALMVAHDGELPLGNSPAANTPSGRQHRFDWRDCQHLKSAPLVLLSAACGSGQSHHAGLGEELGLFSTLRRAGTRSIIAPRWDIEPKVVLPILDSAMERYLRTGVELGEALHAACSEASRVLPHWQAWALALEGDWK